VRFQIATIVIPGIPGKIHVMTMVGRKQPSLTGFASMTSTKEAVSSRSWQIFQSIGKLKL